MAYLLAILDITNRPGNYTSIGWFTTAMLTELQARGEYWCIKQPDEYGLYHTIYQPIAEAIRQKYYDKVAPSSHPFVLKGTALAARYNNESTYFKTSRRTQECTLLDYLNVNAYNGDQLLVLVDLPRPDRRSNLQRELTELINEFNREVALIAGN